MQKFKRLGLTILAAYPAIMLVLTIMPQTIQNWPIPARALFIVCLMVPAIQLLIGPMVNKYLSNWINK